MPLLRRRALPLLALLLPSACGAPPAPASASAPPAAPPSFATSPSNAPSATPTPSPIAAKVDAIFASLAKEPARAPGCAVGVFGAGEVLFAKGYGLASLEHDLPITPTTTFEIGSMSKQFTATAILLLAGDGKLSLDDDVRKTIPELPNYGHVITLRHLLHHTGGLREYDALLSLSGWDDADVATEAEALRLVTLQKGTNFAPGAEWSYSNTGYFLLSVVVKRVSGKSLAAFSKERIFAPLGMNDTSIYDDYTQVIPRHATAYSPREGGGFRVNMSYREMTGEGNIQSTIADLARWDANFYNPVVGGETWLKAMRTVGAKGDGTPVRYAMGLFQGKNHGQSEEEHSGGWAGYVADWRRYPAAKMSFVALCNRDDVNPVGLTNAMAEALLPSAPESAGSPSPPASAAAADSGHAAAPIAASPTFAGSYYEPKSLEVRTFTVKDGTLIASFGPPGSGGRPPMPMEAIDARTFHVAGAPSRWTFEPAKGKTPARVTRVAPGDTPMTFERFELQTPDAAKLAAYVGRYESPEMVHDLEVAVTDGKLEVGPWGKPHEAAKLTPLSRDVFTGPLGMVFSRDAKGKVVGVTGVFAGYPAVHWTKR